MCVFFFFFFLALSQYIPIVYSVARGRAEIKRVMQVFDFSNHTRQEAF